MKATDSGLEKSEAQAVSRRDYVDTFSDAVVWVGLFPLPNASIPASPLLPHHRRLTRLVTYSLGGSINIWQVGHGPDIILRHFQAVG